MAKLKTRRARRSAAQWRALLERQTGSGQSIEAFCRAQSVSAASFYRWRRRLSEGGKVPESAAEPAAARAAFVDLGMLGGCARGWELELALGEGLVLRLRGG